MEKNKWISVRKEIKPKTNELVLITNKQDGWVCAGQINDDGLWYNQWQDKYSDSDVIVTHWMPLPEPPTT